jgi:hypothetical protein
MFRNSCRFCLIKINILNALNFFLWEVRTKTTCFRFYISKIGLKLKSAWHTLEFWWFGCCIQFNIILWQCVSRCSLVKHIVNQKNYGPLRAPSLRFFPPMLQLLPQPLWTSSRNDACGRTPGKLCPRQGVVGHHATPFPLCWEGGSEGLSPIFRWRLYMREVWSPFYTGLDFCWLSGLCFDDEDTSEM